MAKIYKVYDEQKNQFVGTRRNKQEAIDDVRSLCSLGGVTGFFEVHEFDEDDTAFRHPTLVHRQSA
jgi:hypothetical protein